MNQRFIASIMQAIMARPMIIAVSLLCFVLSGLFIVQIYTEWQIKRYVEFEQQQKIQVSLQNDLVRRMQEIVGDQAILASVSTNLIHSLRQSLKNFLLQDVLDQIWIFDASCTELSSARTDSLIAYQCDPADLKNPSLKSLTLNGVSYQLMWTPVLIQNKKVYFVGARKLNSHYKQLPTSMRLIFKRQQDAIILLLSMLLLSLTIVAYWFLEQNKSIAIARKEFSALQNWVRDRLGARAIQMPQSASLLESLETLIKQVPVGVVKNTQELVALKEKIKNMSERLMVTSKWQPQAVWANSYSKKVITTSSVMIERLEKDELHYQQKNQLVIKPCIEVLQRWHLGLKGKEARKFLRSLSETPSGSRHGDMLTRDLSVLESGMSTIANNYEQLLQLIMELHDRESSCLKQAQAFARIFNSDNSANESFVKTLQQIQSLLCHGRVEFINETSRISKNTKFNPFVLGLLIRSYDLLIETALNSGIEFLKIKTHYQKRGEHHLLLVDVESGELRHLDDEDRKMFLDEFSVMKLETDELSIHFSPTLSTLPIVIRWQDNVNKKTNLIAEHESLTAVSADALLESELPLV